MPRKLRPELEALIASGRCNCHTTMDIALSDGTPLFLSTAEIFVDRFGKTQQYLGKLDEVGSLQNSLDIEVDQQDFRVGNVDTVIGQLLTSDVRRMDGALAISGSMFIDLDLDFSTNQHIWDPKMPGKLISGEVADKNVGFSLISIVDAITVTGSSIAEEFQWREPLSNVPTNNPNDFVPSDPPDVFYKPGRYGDYDPVRPILRTD